ncbi:MAG TPA: hypothetical protein ENJ42_05720 [Hellea balneolensis]|uniref:Uncharacterized protein n=1 Tax=Hellea balneolensis TaxID=287478 RepID=A0A7C5M3D4_9PROT|nr:hypothetical protein [Hellea balneolensis]
MSNPFTSTHVKTQYIHSELITACRTQFPDVHNNPSDIGGIAFVPLHGVNALCLFGSLKEVDYHEATQSLAGIQSYSYVVVRSSGGAVQTWLSLAEILAGRVDNVLVDELCMSSCANYIFPIGRKKYVSSASLTVWHGGPTVENTSPRISPRSGGVSGPQKPILQNFAQRTENLYRWLGINSEILNITSGLSLSDDAKNFIEEYNFPYKVAISGYAIPPRVLARCFGFTGMRGMFHLGNLDKIYKLGRSKSNDLNIIVLPASYDAKVCRDISH